uniref:uncharacterized protein LOC108950348 n=1 Tax=Ciona intestinalis TaxID=7719 RepID=UPI00089DB77E|nr:uncharacterized protein LOC108950348 [Ciona intestinalis]|eukprot:XP_018671431.1 uncharacterized protein LOC108950348 [Ciona intestinalis]
MKTFLAVVVSLVVIHCSLAANFTNHYVNCGVDCLQRFLECNIEGNKETGIKCAKPNETFIETFFGGTCPDEAHWIFSAINQQCSGNCYDATIEANYTCSVSNSTIKVAKSRCYNQNCSGIWLEINSTSCNANCGGGAQIKTRRCFDKNGNITKSSYNCQGTNGDKTTQLVNVVTCNTHECPGNNYTTTIKPSPLSDSLPMYIYIIIGCGAAFLLIVVVIVVCIICSKRKPSKPQPHKTKQFDTVLTNEHGSLSSHETKPEPLKTSPHDFDQNRKSEKETLESGTNATDCESGGVVIDNDVISYITMHSLRKSIPEPDWIPSVELYGKGDNLVASSATDSESWESESNDEKEGNPNIKRERTRKVRKSKKTRRTLKQVPTDMDKQYDVPNVFPSIPDIYAVKTEVNNTTPEGSDSAYDSLNNIPKQRFTSRPSPVPRTSRIRHNKITL